MKDLTKGYRFEGCLLFTQMSKSVPVNKWPNTKLPRCAQCFCSTGYWDNTEIRFERCSFQKGRWQDQLFHLEANRCGIPYVFVECFASMLRRCASSTTTTNVAHTWCDRNSFCTHCQTASEPVFWWKEVRTLKNNQLACTIPWSWSSAFLVIRKRNDIGEFWTDQRLRRITPQS